MPSLPRCSEGLEQRVASQYAIGHRFVLRSLQVNGRKAAARQFQASLPVKLLQRPIHSAQSSFIHLARLIRRYAMMHASDMPVCSASCGWFNVVPLLREPYRVRQTHSERHRYNHFWWAARGPLGKSSRWSRCYLRQTWSRIMASERHTLTSAMQMHRVKRALVLDQQLRSSSK